MSTSDSLPNEKIIFKCDGHAATICEKLQSFYEDYEFFDTVLIAGSDSIIIQGHRIVLSALSEYFLETFRGGQTESNKDNVLQLKELEAPTLKLVIDFMYSGWIELSMEKVESILKTAAFLKMKTVVNGCCAFIENHISPINCLKWLRFAKELSLAGLKEKSLNYVHTHFEEVSKENEFLLLNEEELKDLLFNDNTHGDFEDHVFLAMVAWIEYDKISREALTFHLLSMVSYQYLTPKFIVENRKSVCKTVESYELICSWLQWHLSPETRSVDQTICVSKTKKLNSKLTAMSYTDSYRLTVQTYNPKLNSWAIEKETLLESRKAYSSMIVIDEKLIVVGGSADEITTSMEVECLDLRTFKWANLPPMQNGRNICQLANLNGNLCVFGGYLMDYKFVNSLDVYNFSTRKWNTLELLSEPSEFARIVVHNGIVHIVDLYEGCMQSYDTFSNKWISKELVKKKLKWFGLAAVDRYLYVIGGKRKNVLKKAVSRYNLSDDTWCEMAPLSKAKYWLNTLVVK